jgi:hypothetical protein
MLGFAKALHHAMNKIGIARVWAANWNMSYLVEISRFGADVLQITSDRQDSRFSIYEPQISSVYRAGTPAFRTGMKRVLLVVNVLSDNGERRTATRSNEVGRRPQHATPITASYLWPQLAQAAARHAFKRIDAPGKRDFRGIADKQVDKVVFAITRRHLTVKVVAHLRKDGREIADSQLRARIAAIFCDKDQMSMKRIYDMPSPSNISVILADCDPLDQLVYW